MVVYVCASCGKEIKSEEVKKRVRCKYCESKILFKPRVAPVSVDAD